MILPSPPSDAEKYLYVDQNKAVLYCLAIVSLSALTAGVLLFTANSYWLLPIGAYALLTAIYLATSYILGLFSRSFDFELHQHIVATYTKLNAVP